MKFGGSIGRALTVFVNAIWLGLLGTLCALPVVTLGASMTAMYYAMVKGALHERGNPTKLFFGAFKSNFKTATLSWLIFLIYTLVVVSDIYFVRQSKFAGGALETMSWLLLIPAALVGSWLFAYLSRFENTVLGGFKFLIFFALQNLWKTIWILLTLGLCALAVYFLPGVLPLLPGLVCLLISRIVEPAFRPLTGELGEADAWYNE